MITLISQMVLCLVAAAAIGAAVGWLLRHRSAEVNDHQVTDLQAELRVKGQALDTAIYELKVKTAALTAMEGKEAYDAARAHRGAAAGTQGQSCPPALVMERVGTAARATRRSGSHTGGIRQ